LKKRKTSFKEVALAYTPEQARKKPPGVYDATWISRINLCKK